MLCYRVPEFAIHEVNLRQGFKYLWRQSNLPIKKLEGLFTSNYRRCI
jgi:hypothetical protein